MPALGLRLLIVEDDHAYRRQMASLFASWSITEAEDGEAAIRELWDAAFDAIVLDLMLPNLTGYDVIRHLSMRRPDQLSRTVVVTAANDATIGFVDTTLVHAVLRKPVEHTMLYDTVMAAAAPSRCGGS